MNEAAPGIRGNVTPPGFSRGVRGAIEFVARNDAFDEVNDVLAKHGSLYEWARLQPQNRVLRGRAPVYVATFPVSGLQVAVRHAWHGGFLAPITRDLFLAPTRAPRELNTSLQLAAVGVATTAVIGFSAIRTLRFFRRVDVMSTYMPDAIDLGAVIEGHTPHFSVEEIVCALSILLQQLDRAGAIHPDLNAKNILLSRCTNGHIEAAVIDVDVIRLARAPLSPHTRRENRSRLARSIKKIAAISRPNRQAGDAANARAITLLGAHPNFDGVVRQLLEVCESDV